MNKAIKYLIISDIFIFTGFGLINPILAIFVKENLIGGTIFAAGLASMIFMLTKSLVQLPFSRYIDSHDSRIKWLILGTFIIAFVPVIYLLSSNIKHIYLAQFLYGIGSGLAFPAWLGIWSFNLDKGHESFEWSLYSTLVGVGTAVSAAVGATIAGLFGFKYTFVFVGVMSMVGCGVLFNLEKKYGKGVTQYRHHRRKNHKSH
ncbi:MAG: MFS transporter [archaeon]